MKSIFHNKKKERKENVLVNVFERSNPEEFALFVQYNAILCDFSLKYKKNIGGRYETKVQIQCMIALKKSSINNHILFCGRCCVGKYKKICKKTLIFAFTSAKLHRFSNFLASMYCFIVLYFETTLVMALLFDELKEYTYTYIRKGQKVQVVFVQIFL